MHCANCDLLPVSYVGRKSYASKREVGIILALKGNQPHERVNTSSSFSRPTAAVETGCDLSTPSVLLYSFEAIGSHHRSAGLDLRTMVRSLNLPATTAKLPVLRYAKACAAVERADAAAGQSMN